MFTRPMFNAQPELQGAILDKISALLDAKTLSTTLVTQLPWTAAGLAEAHQLLETGRAIGKAVLAPVGEGVSSPRRHTLSSPTPRTCSTASAS